MSRAPSSDKNPTPTEYALVAIVMGTIGLVGLPRSPRAPVEAREAQVCAEARQSLETIREAVEEYRLDHGRLPGNGLRGEDPLEVFMEQLTSRTTVTGAVPVLPWDSRAHFGPYLVELPTNPFNGLANVRVLERGERFPRRPDGRTGWIYHPRTGIVRANARGELPGASQRIYDL
jgi:type II secretory pathway pseudopilin PulG